MRCHSRARCLASSRWNSRKTRSTASVCGSIVAARLCSATPAARTKRREHHCPGGGAMIQKRISHSPRSRQAMPNGLNSAESSAWVFAFAPVVASRLGRSLLAARKLGHCDYFKTGLTGIRPRRGKRRLVDHGKAASLTRMRQYSWRRRSPPGFTKP
jgi:hypothetical protein